MAKLITDLEKLNQAASPLEFLDKTGTHPEEGQKIIDKLKKAMKADSTIMALSAPQLGIDKRIICIRFNDGIHAFINPIVTKKLNYKIGIETCASMPGKEILINRPEEITIVYYNGEFKYEDNKLLGWAARIFDQQTNLLDGVTPNELGLVSDIAADGSFADLTEEEIPQVLNIYKQYVSAKLKALKTAINDNEAVSLIYNRLAATEKVINGEIQVVSEEPEKPKAHLNREQRRAIDKQAKKMAANRKSGKK